MPGDMKGARRGARDGPASASQRARLADEHHAKGYSFRKQGNFAAAVEEYSQAIHLEPHHFKALFNRGFSWDKVLSCFTPITQAVVEFIAVEASCFSSHLMAYKTASFTDVG